MKVVGERKAVAARLAELTGERAVYTKMPRCAYEVGPFAIERDGSITVSESADLAALRTLAQEGLLEGWEELTKEAITEAQESATEAENTTAAEASDVPTEMQEEALTISLPLAGHTASSLRNLVTMIYSRGSLLSKATGGHFACPLEQVDALKDYLTVESVLSCLTPGLTGLTIADDKITFVFPSTDDPDKVKAFTQLAAQMSKASKEQKRVMAKTVDESNERYIFRIWLLALGMAGDEFKAARKVLLAPLSGNAAFKDQAMEQRWKDKQNAKRDALRAAKAQQTEESTACEVEVMKRCAIDLPSVGGGTRSR